MTRSMLLGAVSAAALIVSSGAFAQPAITGGGSTLAEFDYFVEFLDYNNLVASNAPMFNNANPSPFAPATADEGLYWASGSGTGQNSFLFDNLTCDANKTLKNNAVSPYCTAPSQVGGGVNLETIYGASDATLSAAQYTGWTSGTSYTDYSGQFVTTVPSQQAIAGNLIELPSMGVGVSFPIVNSGVTSNAQVELQDTDICGIFSGKITNWSTIAADSYNKNKKIAAGEIQVVYRSDSSGTTFILTEHLAKACPTVSGAPASFLGFTPTQTFATLFTNSTPPSNFVGVSGSQAIASYLSGQTETTVPANTAFANSDITYLTPDLTTIDPNSNAFLANGAKSALVVAAVYTANSKKYFTPTESNIATGLTHVLTYDTVNGSSGVPASAAEAEANNAFVQVPTSIGSGYAYSGYTTFDFAQCYAGTVNGKATSVGTAMDTAITSFLNYHYSNATFTAVQINNGFVPLSKTGATNYLAAIDKYVVDDTGTKGKYPDQGTQIGSATGCADLTGR